MDDHALHMDSVFPRLVIAAEDYARERMVEFGVLVDDDRCVAAEFEHDLFLARLRLQVPADTRRAGERQQFQPFVGGEQVGARARRGQDAERTLGQDVAFGEHLTHDDRAQRSEEHTSELQSLMRISYAVFCLKKNTLSPSSSRY